jgi:uncharacterized protein YdhG (YjbR/CyaY superfamily)
MATKFTSVDQYLSLLPPETRILCEQLRAAIRKAAPKADEVISYNMPAYKQHGILAYFAAYKKHIGFYPSTSPILVFQKELQKFKTSKGAIQFSIDQKIPLTLVKKMVQFRVKEDAENAKLKKRKQAAKKKQSN